MDEKTDNRWKFCTKMAVKADSSIDFSFIGSIEDDDIENKALTKDKHLSLLIYDEY